MKTIGTLVSFIALCTLLTAQKAPDFTITDYNGKVHKLYDDYLNEGKAVMIKIMFVTCPPCNSAAPGVQALYEHFGEGSGDVEFFDLSNKSWDSNGAVKGFAEKHGLTFTGAGIDGGALDAVDPYVSGNFGTFRGTPTFVVIDKEGNVNFDVSMSNLKDAIQDAIDGGGSGGGCTQAFEGEITGPTEGISVNLVSNIPGAQTYSLNDDGDSMFGYACEFTFPPQAFNYSIEVSKDGEDLNGVSAKDIVALTRHLLGIELITDSNQKIAADFTANDVISARDISEMRRLILGVTASNTDHDSWRFYHESTDFTHDSSGIVLPDLVEDIPLMDVVDSVLTANFHGIKLGDVSGDVNQFFGPQNETRSSLDLHFQDAYVAAGQNISVSVYSDQDLSLLGIQGAVRLNGKTGEVTVSLDDSDSHTTGEITRFLAYASYPEKVKAEHQVFTIEFTSLEDGWLSDLIHLSEDISPEVVFADGKSSNFKLVPEVNHTSFDIYPNPGHDRIIVSGLEANVKLNIIDQTGNQINAPIHSNGTSRVVDLSDVASGFYMIKVNQNGKISTKKFLKI